MPQVNCSIIIQRFYLQDVRDGSQIQISLPKRIDCKVYLILFVISKLYKDKPLCRFESL